MKFLSYVFKKDLRKLQGALILWLILLGIQASLGIGGIKLTADNLMLQVLLPQLGWLIKFLQGLMVVILIPLLIQDDPLVGTTGFWFTRPIGRQPLFVTKTVFVVGILLFFPLLAEIIVFLVNGVLAKDILLAVPEIILEKMAFMIPFIILATITPKFSRYALVGAIIFAAYIIWGILFMVLSAMMPGNWLTKATFNYKAFDQYTLSLSIKVVKHILMIILGSTILIDQYRTRNTRKTVLRVMASFILLVVFSNIWTIDFLKPTSQRLQNKIVANPSVNIDPHHALVTDTPSYRKGDPREKVISAQVGFSGLPAGQFAILTKLSPTMKWPNDELPSGYVSMSSKELMSYAKFMAPLQAVLPTSTIVNPFTNQKAYKEAFRLNDAWFNRYKNKPGTYEAMAELDIYKYRVSSSIPLRLGARGIFGSQQIVIFDILHLDTGISVILGEKKTNLLFDRHTEKTNPYQVMRFSDFNTVYLIENTKRKEAFLAEVSDTSMFNYDQIINSQSRLFSRAKRLDFLYINDRNGPLPKLDDTWFEDAQLTRVDAVLIGHTKKALKFEGFVLPEKSTDAMPEPDPLEDAMKRQDEKMRRLEKQ